MKCSKIGLIVLSIVVLVNITACSSVKFGKDGNTDIKKEELKTEELNKDGFVATVSDQNITVPEYNFMLTYVKNDMETAAGVSSADAEAKKTYWETKTGDEDNKTVAKNEALKRLKELKIILIKAKENKIELDETDLNGVKGFIDNFVNMEATGDMQQAETKSVEVFGVGLKDLESIYKDYFIVGKYATDTAQKIVIKDEDIKAFYEKNATEKVNVKHILLLTQDSTTGEPLSEEKKAEKKKAAEDILNRVKSGEDFATLVSEFSEDPGSIEKGGEYVFGRGEMVPEFEEWAFNAKEGDTGIVETTYGFHIMKFIKKVGLEDEKEGIMVQLQSEEYLKQVEEWKADEKYNLKTNQKLVDSVSLF